MYLPINILPCFSLSLFVYLSPHTHMYTHFLNKLSNLYKPCPLTPKHFIVYFLRTGIFVSHPQSNHVRKLHAHTIQDLLPIMSCVSIFFKSRIQSRITHCSRCCVSSVISNLKHFLNFCFSRHRHVLFIGHMLWKFPQEIFLSCLTSTIYVIVCPSVHHTKRYMMSAYHNWRCNKAEAIR